MQGKQHSTSWTFVVSRNPISLHSLLFIILYKIFLCQKFLGPIHLGPIIQAVKLCDNFFFFQVETGLWEVYVGSKQYSHWIITPESLRFLLHRKQYLFPFLETPISKKGKRYVAWHRQVHFCLCFLYKINPKNLFKMVSSESDIYHLHDIYY